MAPIVSMLPLVVPVFCTLCTFGTFRLGLRLGLGLVHRHGGIHEPLQKCFHGVSLCHMITPLLPAQPFVALGF